MEQNNIQPWQDKVENFLPYCDSERHAAGMAVTMRHTLISGDVLYPLTIIHDRYSGVYSGGLFTAWLLDFHCIPKEIDESDPECCDFWQHYKGIVGRGYSITAAYDDLLRRMKEVWDGE